MLRDLRYRLRALFRRGAVERELDDELRFHLERAIDEKVRAGHPPEEAARLARLELGGIEAVKEDCRDARGVRPIDDLVVDVRYGVRILRRAPAFTAVAVLTLALGIGANTAMFSLVDAILRHPLPYDRPEQLVRLHASKPSFDKGSISFPNFLDWQARNRTFSAMAVARSGSFTLTGAGSAERVSAALISADYFTVLDVHPLLGRTLARGDDLPGKQAVVLLGERLWQRKYGAAQDIVGRTIVLDGKGYAVIGVMPSRQDLRAVAGGDATDLYVPIGQVDSAALQRRGAGMGIHGIGRLAPGVTIDQARADLAAVCLQLAEVYPETNRQLGASMEPLRDSVVGNVRPYVLLLFGAVGLVLLIACVNVANLLLARSAGRAREFGIRLALGASVGRLVRQLLTESLLLAVAGGVLGLGVAWWWSDTLFTVLPRGLPHVALGLDINLLVFTAAISLLAGVLAGLTPALRAARPDLHDTLKEGGRGPSTTRYRAQAVFVIVQMAMALVLLVGAGLLVRTLVGLSRADPGFERAGVVTAGISLSPTLRDADVRAELRRLAGALATAPGVEAAALAVPGAPLEGDDQIHFVIDGQPMPATQDQLPWVVKFVVGPDYLATMRMPLVRGRFFTARDDDHAPRVVVIDDVFARMYFPGVDPVGRHIRTNDYEMAPAEIVGVVGHVKQWGLDQDETSTVRAQLYEPFLQLVDEELPDMVNGVVAVARTRGDDAASIGGLRTAVQQLGAENVMFRARTTDDIIAGYQTTRRFAMYLLAAFAALALLLSCVGIYGVVSYVVDQRTTEIGIRMALGARGRDILALVLRQGAKLVLAGVALGLAGAYAASPFMAKLIYGVSSDDPLTLAGVACGVAIIALAAMLLPARRAMRMQPMQALRTD
jgi:putative ABC transport system permease protein